MDFNSPEFKRKFPKFVLALCFAGLALVAIAALLTAIGYNQ